VYDSQRVLGLKVWRKEMNEYTVELIHEPSGAHMNFVMFSDLKEDEVQLSKEIWADMSVVVLDYVEGEE
jgi:hypothetical protein